MKILFSITYYTPYISGLTIHAERLASLFADKGYDIRIITTQYEKTLPVSETIEKTDINRVPYWFKLHKGFIMPKYFLTAWTEVKNADIIVSHLPQVESLVLAFYSFLLKKPYYCIYHCDVNLPISLFNKFIEIILRVISVIVIGCCRNVITYTKDYAMNNTVLKLFSKKVIYIYPPIPDPRADDKLTQKLRSKLPNDNYYIIGVAARFAAEKGIEYLLDAIPLLQEKLKKRFIVVFAGPRHPVGEENYWKSMQNKININKESIYFLDTISQNSMGSFYSLLDVLVLPSTNSTEAFGLVQVEAMLCHVPVIASNLPGVRVPIKATGMGELVKIKDSTDLAEKLFKVLKRRKDYIKSTNYISKIFSIHDTITKYEKVFRGIS